MTFNAGPTFRERALSATEKFIREKVPTHTRAQYEALLATNTDLAIELIAKWRDLEDLKAAYHQLQFEVGEREGRLPPVTARAAREDSMLRLESIYRVEWVIAPHEAMFALPASQVREAPPELVLKAFKRYFDEKYVPTLWNDTTATLWPILQGDR
jgi:hypothetical protein